MTTADGTLTILNGKGKYLTINGTKKKYSGSNLPAGLSYNTARTALTITNKYNADDIDIQDYASTLRHMNASTRTDDIELIGNSKNNSLIGGKGSDVLRGGSGDDTLKGGSGSDSFVHYEGNDTITDYKPGTDKIYLDNTEIIGVNSDVNNLILITDNGSIKIKNGVGKKITVVDSEGDPTTKVYGNLPNGLKYNDTRTALTASKNFTESTIDLADYADTVKKVDASKVTENIEITGNRLSNTLIGGKGADILSGGSGNDTLTGNGGKDIFIHTEGDDVITDYTAGKDKIQLENTEINGWKVIGKNVVFDTDNGSITVKNGKGQRITIIDDDGESTSKIYSKSSSLLDDIIENNLIGEFENYKSEITQENLITYAEK